MALRTDANRIACGLALLCGMSLPAHTQTAHEPQNPQLVIQQQGSFAVGGTFVTSPGVLDPRHPTAAGQTLHGDHAYFCFKIPAHRRKLPLVFLHGTGQFSKTWETTPDGREASRTSFCAAGLRSTCRTSRAAAMPVVQRFPQP